MWAPIQASEVRLFETLVPKKYRLVCDSASGLLRCRNGASQGVRDPRRAPAGIVAVNRAQSAATPLLTLGEPLRTRRPPLGRYRQPVAPKRDREGGNRCLDVRQQATSSNSTHHTEKRRAGPFGPAFRLYGQIYFVDVCTIAFPMR